MPERHRSRVAAGATAAAVVVIGAGVAAGAGPTGRWTPISAGSARPADEAGLARTADGILHVLWQRRGARTSALWETQIAPDGTGTAGVVAPGLADGGSPSLTVAPDGSLRAFFFARTAGAPGANLLVAARQATGVWTVGADSLAEAPGADVPTVAAAAARDGTPIVTWTAGAQIRYRIGLDAKAPSRTLAAGGCCASGVQPAIDQASGQAYVAWASNAAGGAGVYVQAVDRSGPSRARLYATGSSTPKRKAAVLPPGRVALTARPGAGGVYLAYTVGYPKVRTIALLQVASRRRVLAIRAPGVSTLAVAPGPQGRLWLAWSRGGAIFATRTNRNVSRIGAVRSIALRQGATGVARLAIEGSPGALDLVAGLAARAGVKLWHDEVLPGLSLGIDATSAGGATRYVFRVTDAGEAVANATVRFGKQSLTTGVSGTVTLVTTDRPSSATASKPGYAPATAPLG